MQIDPSAEDISQMAHCNVFLPILSESRRAILVPSELAYGLGRMFEILQGAEGEPGVRVFRNLEQALD